MRSKISTSLRTVTSRWLAGSALSGRVSAWMATLLVALSCVLAPAALAAQGLLWKVVRPGIAANYLFATVHLEDPRILALPAPVRAAFKRARSVTLEVDLDPAHLGRLRRAMYFRDGRSLATVLGPSLYSEVVHLLATHGVSESMAQAMKPWAVLTTLSMPPPKTGVFLDAALYRDARAAGKPVYGLETLGEQIGYFDTLALSDQIALLRDTVRQYPMLGQMLAQMRRAYLDRDLDALAAINRRYQRGSDPAVTKRFMQRFVTRRNRLMAARMQPRLESGGAFVAVGALHLPGPQGLIALLRVGGWQVTPVY